MFGSAESEDTRLPILVITIPQRHEQRDRRTDDLPRQYRALRSIARYIHTRIGIITSSEKLRTVMHELTDDLYSCSHVQEICRCFAMSAAASYRDADLLFAMTAIAAVDERVMSDIWPVRSEFSDPKTAPQWPRTLFMLLFFLFRFLLLRAFLFPKAVSFLDRSS